MAGLLMTGFVTSYVNAPKKITKIVLLGRTGAGKSATGNTILGEKRFESRFCARTITRECQKGRANVSGRRVIVLDTPGLYDTVDNVDRITEETENIKAFARRDKCVFLLVIALDRFTEEERKSVEKIKRLFSDVPLSKFMILFTCGDKLEGTLEEFISDAGSEFQELLNFFGKRYHVFNNKAKSNDEQVSELLKKIDKMWMEREHGDSQPQHLNTNTADESSSSEDVTEEDMEKPPLRIVLLGKTGVGKSVTGNTILDSDVFESESGLYSQTKWCQLETRYVHGRSVSVVDTPGFFDFKRTTEEIAKEVVRSITLSAPGPHVFLLVISLKERFTKDGKETIAELLRRFGDDLKKYTMILFSHSDTLKQNQRVEDLINSDRELDKILSPFENRIHCFDNSDQSNRDQVRELLEKIDRMVAQNGGGHYTDEMYRRAEETIRAEEERLHREYDDEFLGRAEEELQRSGVQDRVTITIGEHGPNVTPVTSNNTEISESIQQRGVDRNTSSESSLLQRIKAWITRMWSRFCEWCRQTAAEVAFQKHRRDISRSSSSQYLLSVMVE